jgi:acyl carrier protein
MRSEVQSFDSETAQDSTATEVLVTTILKELLPLDDINLNEHLVGLGGDSLVAIELMARLSEAAGINLSPVLPFEVATLQELVSRIDSIRQSFREGAEDEVLESGSGRVCSGEFCGAPEIE